MTRIIPRKLAERRGAVAIMVAILMVVLLGFAAFTIDFGYAYVVKNELQNAADAAALAGASVLFADNNNCLNNDSPYSCCSGLDSGSCDPKVVNRDNVIATAQEVAAKNKSSGKVVPVPTVEIGHYTFASSNLVPGNFDPNPTLNQLDNWATQKFVDLNTNPNFRKRPEDPSLPR